MSSIVQFERRWDFVQIIPEVGIEFKIFFTDKYKMVDALSSFKEFAQQGVIAPKIEQIVTSKQFSHAVKYFHPNDRKTA